MKIEKRILTVCLVTGFFLIGLGLVIMPAGVDAAYTGIVTINADGSLSPAAAPIDVKGKSYTLNDDIDGMLVVRCKNADVDGNGYTITGDGTNYGIHLDNADGVTIKNFNVYGAYVGIRVDTCCKITIKDNSVVNSAMAGIALWYSSDDNTVKDNYVSGNYAGIVLIYYCSNNVIKDNTLVSNGYGLDTYHSPENMFMDNTLTNNVRWGITFRYSADNVAKGNSIDGGLYYGIAIYYGTGGHIVRDNLIKNVGSIDINFGVGIYLDSESDIMVNDNELYDNFIGIGSWFNEGNTIKCNHIARSTVPGIYLDTVTGHLVEGNEIIDGGHGIYFYNRNSELDLDNIVIENLIEDNGYGIFTEDAISGGNTLHHNNIISNTIQVFEGGPNNWDDGKGEGNYWSDYCGVDTDDDGVGDTCLPHNGVDNYPLMEQC